MQQGNSGQGGGLAEKSEMEHIRNLFYAYLQRYGLLLHFYG